MLWFDARYCDAVAVNGFLSGRQVVSEQQDSEGVFWVFFPLRAFTSLFWEDRESITIQIIVPFFYSIAKKEALDYSDLMSRGADSPSSTGAEPLCTDTFNEFRYFFRESEHRGSRERQVDLTLQFLTCRLVQPAVQ